MSFPCCLLACLRPSLFHAVQTYSQRQNKSPNDKLRSSYHSSKVKCYQTGIMPKMLAKKRNRNYKGKKKQEEARQSGPQLCRSPAPQRSSCRLIQLLLLLSFPFLFTQISVSFSSLGVPEHPFHRPQPLQLLCAPSRSYKTGGEGWLKI